MQKESTKTKNDYELIKEIGSGAYGTVYKALDKESGNFVAVKLIDLQEDWLPLLAEVNMVIDLQHISIVNYYTWFFEEGRLWLVMEFCDGGSLAAIMQKLKRGLTERELAAVSRGVLESLVYVHSLNRIHRDIKSGNLLVTSQGQVKLCDFGVSAQLDDQISRTGTRIGSPYWMAPEVITAVGHNTKADIWSFGITALELLTGNPPLHEFNPMVAMLKIPNAPAPEAPADSSPEFRAFIQKIMVKDPELRPTAADLLQDPFVNQITSRDSTEIIRNLVNQYNTQNEVDEYSDDYYDGDYDEDYDEDDEISTGNLSYETAKVILYSDSTFVAEPSTNDDTFIACGNSNDSTFIVSNSNDGTFVQVPQDGTFVQVPQDGTFVQCPQDGTFIQSPQDGTFVQQSPNKPQGNGLAGWKPEFIEPSKSQTKVKAAQKRNFRNFREQDLNYMLKSVKELAHREILEGKVQKELIIANYEDVRRGIVQELQKRGKEVCDDYEKIYE